MEGESWNVPEYSSPRKMFLASSDVVAGLRG